MLAPLPLWVVMSVCVVALFLLGPTFFVQPMPNLKLGTDWPMQVLEDAHGRMTVDDVAALPDSAFKTQHAPLNEGYSHKVYWVKVAAPPILPAAADPLWLEVMPAYLDKVTLYQRLGETWRAYDSGDTVPLSQRVRVRQLVFPLVADTPFILRVQTLSATQVHAVVRRSTGLMAWLAGTEWAAGVHLGINLLLSLLIIGAALALRTRSLVAMAAFSTTVLLHGFNVQGYAHLWLPDHLSRWSDLLVSVGVFILPATFAWQVRELLTRGTRWRRVDTVLLALAIAPLLAIASIPLNRYPPFAAFAITVPWLASMLGTWVAWNNLRQSGPSAVHLLLATPYSLYAVVGSYVTATAMGLLPAQVDTRTYWQLMALLLNILIAVAVGADLLERFRQSMAQRAQLVKSLEQSEQSLEERVRERTAELLRTQNALQAALHSERELRQDQRQFFNMVNHEFRTPLAVIDSAATEQWSFPSPDLDPQVERAAQIRRACRRLTTLVDNCLVSERLDAAGFGLQQGMASVPALAEEAAQLVRWSPRHHLRLRTQDAPAQWPCDPTLVHIALSNLVDNAVKYAQAGQILVAATLNAQGSLELSVTDEGPGLPPDAVQRIFDQFERGHRTDQARGFGLGLWVARRVARLHGGDVRVHSAPGRGTCFTLTLPGETNPR